MSCRRTARAGSGGRQHRRQGRGGERVLWHTHGARSAILPRHPDPADRLRPGIGNTVPDRGVAASAGEGGSGMMRTLYGASPADIAGMDTERLRAEFLVDGLFRPGAIEF